jgi:folate-binding protein YgfZ
MLQASHKREKVRLGDAFGLEYPAWFIHPAAEYQALVHHAGVLDLTHWPIWRVTGKDRASFLNAMLTNDLASLEVDRGAHSLLTTIKGKIIAELYMWARESDVLVCVSQGNAAEAQAVLQKHIIMEDVTIDDVSSDFGVVALEGVKLDDIMWRMFEKGPFPKEKLQAHARKFGDVDVYVTRNSVTGMDGYHMLLPSASIERFWDYLVQGARGSDGLPVGSVAWNMCRVEKGLPWFGIDFGEDNFPDESRLGDTVSYSKGCFRGQETLARLHHRGHVNRRLVGLVPAESPPEVAPLADAFALDINNYDEGGLRQEATAVAERLDLQSLYPPGSELRAESADKPLGFITSAVYSPRLKKPLLLGYVRREALESGEDLRLGDRSLQVTDLPLADAD